MASQKTITAFLGEWAGGDAGRKGIADTIGALCAASINIGDLVSRGPLDGDQIRQVAGSGSSDLVKQALSASPVAAMASITHDKLIALNDGAPLAVMVSPLDGLSNVETNVTIGTIFSILPADGGKNAKPENAFFQSGNNQLAAGFIIYGPQTTIVFTVGDGTHFATLDRTSGEFVITRQNVKMGTDSREYAINASNYRFWSPAIRAYIEVLLSGTNGPRHENFNMRWIASLVAETYRILVRGGIFLYPGDIRPGYNCGHLRLLFEAFPIAMIIEQAGGTASEGTNRILDLVPEELQERTPLFFGQPKEVQEVQHHLESPPNRGTSSPLFASRGLFR